MIAISVLLLAAGIGAVYYFYTISALSVRQPSTPGSASSVTAASSIVTPDKQKIIDVTGLDPANTLSLIEKQWQANPLSGGGILEIILGQQASTTQNGKTVMALTKVTGPQFISIIGLAPPDALTSTLTNQWMLGFYTSANNVVATTTTPFVILTENFFQNAFSGMLKWEPTMPSDLSALFGIQSSQWEGGSFQDKLVGNKDVREFTDSNGNTLFLYSFIDNNTLVIAQNEAALGEIISRFESRAYVR
jgi:hypothetical protein